MNLHQRVCPDKDGIFYIEPKVLGREIALCLRKFLKREPRQNELALMLGTAGVESDFKYLVQKGGGPGRGYFQMEPYTAKSLLDHYFSYRPSLKESLIDLVTITSFVSEDFLEEVTLSLLQFLLVYNLPFMIILTRANYLKDPKPLPDFSDIDGLAGYWKRVHNTKLGAGKVEHFTEKYSLYGINKVVEEIIDEENT